MKNRMKMTMTINKTIHKIAHILGINFTKKYECLSCGKKQRTDTLVVPGHGNLTYFTPDGPEDGATFEEGYKNY